MVLFALPSYVVDSILSYLTFCELKTFREVCRDAKKIATDEIRKRYKCKAFNVGCCTTECTLNAKLGVFGCKQIHVKYRPVCHSSCSNGSALFNPSEKSAIMKFNETETLNILSRPLSSNPRPSPCFLSFSEKFVLIKHLYLFKVQISMDSFCVALRERWNSIMTVSVKTCDGLITPQMLLALNANVTSITAKNCLHPLISGTTKNAFGDIWRVSAASISESVVPNLEYLSIDVLEEFEEYHEFNATKMISVSMCLREVHLNIFTWRNTNQFFDKLPLLERLRLHIFCLPNAQQEFYFFDKRDDGVKNENHRVAEKEAKTRNRRKKNLPIQRPLRKVEIKFVHCTPTKTFMRNLIDVIASVETIAVTGTYFDCGEYFFDAIGTLRNLDEFVYRKHFHTFVWYEGKWCDALLRFLEHRCRAKLVSLYFRRHYFVKLKQPEVLNFVYEIVRIALSRPSVTYMLTFTNRIGCAVFPENIKFQIIRKYVSVQKIWSTT